MQNIITNDELIPSAHNHAKPMLGAVAFRSTVARQTLKIVEK